MKDLSKDFYKGDTIEIAKSLLGKILIHKLDNGIVSGRIVEVEAYMGEIDKAAHSYKGKTKRNKVMFGKKGVAYVYLIYGMYNCFNVTSGEEGKPEAILIRALEPLEGLEQMSFNRYNKSFKELKENKIIGLTNGPGKLCQAMDIDRSYNGIDLTCGNLSICDEGYNNFNIVSSKRVGIDYAEEAKNYLWRFYIENNKYVSK